VAEELLQVTSLQQSREISSSVQAELMLPDEIETALAERSVVYLPLGSIEYHSHHLPVGLDGLNAHGICTRAAERGGGIVLPTLYYGVGGGHTTYPWTIMAASSTPVTELLEQSLRRLEDFGVRVAVLFTGHFADEQLAMIDGLATRWNAGHAAGDGLRALALSVNRTDARLAPDHAGIFETTLLSALWPNRVRLDRLPTLEDVPAPDPDGAVGYDHRHDPAHPLWGVMGPDPRAFDAGQAPGLLEEIVDWTSAQVARVVEQVG
jgi:creatinine amidohydrolase